MQTTIDQADSKADLRPSEHDHVPRGQPKRSECIIQNGPNKCAQGPLSRPKLKHFIILRARAPGGWASKSSYEIAFEPRWRLPTCKVHSRTASHLVLDMEKADQ